MRPTTPGSGQHFLDERCGWVHNALHFSLKGVAYSIFNSASNTDQTQMTLRIGQWQCKIPTYFLGITIKGPSGAVLFNHGPLSTSITSFNDTEINSCKKRVSCFVWQCAQL